MSYFRNGTGSPLLGYAEPSERWEMSKATAGRMLKRLVRQGYLSLLSFPGWRGSAGYLNNYLSTMFQISDVMIDKEKVAMSLNIKIPVSDDAESELETTITEKRLSVSVKDISVSKAHLRQIIGKVAQILSAGGLACCDCPKSKYKLYPLSPDCKEGLRDYILTIVCGETELYRFDLRLYPVTKV